MRALVILLLIVTACRPSLKYHFNSVEEINQTTFHPGDSVFLSGLYKGEIRLDGADSGTKENPVVIRGTALIDAGNGTGLSITNARHIHVINLRIKGSGRKDGNTSSGVVSLNSSDLLFDSLSVEGFQKSGLLIEKSKRIEVTRVRALNNGFAGISAQGENISITACLAENNPGDPTNFTNHSGNGIIVGYSKNVLIDDCTATNNGWDMPRIGNGPVGIWAYESDSVTIQRCVSYRNHTSKGGEDGGGFDLDGGVTNSVIQYCISYENDGSGIGLFQYDGASPWKNNIIRYNVSLNDGLVSTAHAGIYIWNSSGDSSQLSEAYLFGNMIYNKNGGIVRFATDSEHTKFYYLNNFFSSGVTFKAPVPGDDVFQLNFWWRL
ncbi:MAG TPA: right-handed parallel beta-helix repeat-containing protein [Cyclobacteriaceae bacterium]|nr:right-handed parallel beta-helix repeat-containing protein [Cyclobacteriaceae bacterium]